MHVLRQQMNQPDLPEAATPGGVLPEIDGCEVETTGARTVAGSLGHRYLLTVLVKAQAPQLLAPEPLCGCDCKASCVSSSRSLEELDSRVRYKNRCRCVP